MSTIHKAGILLYRSRGDATEVLVVKSHRSQYWSIPKGKCEQGEQLEVTARRETAEETGLNIDGMEFLGKSRYHNRRMHCFLAPAPLGEPMVRAVREIEKAEYMEVNKAIELIHPSQKKFLKSLRERLDAN